MDHNKDTNLMSKLLDGPALRSAGLRNKTIRLSYNYCGICGHFPKKDDEPNYDPLRWWDCDDGWKIGALCHWCHDEVVNDKPKEGDFATSTTNGVADDVNTDQDPSPAFP